MNTRTLPALVASLALLGLAVRPAAAQTVYYTSDTTINSTINYGYVGYASDANIQNGTNPTSPTVALVTGGLVKDQSTSGNLNVYNHSTLNMTGGTVNYELISHDTATLNVSGGSVGPGVGALYAEGSSTANISGGFIGIVAAYDNSTMTITGGTTGQHGNGGESFYDDTTGSFTFVGTGLSATRLNYSNYYQGYDYLLTGILQSGESITGKTIAVAGGAKMFTLAAAPEPSAVVSLALGALGLSGLMLRARQTHKERNA